MARFIADRPENGNLVFRVPRGGVVNVDFAPIGRAKSAAQRLGRSLSFRLAELNLSESVTWIYPLNTLVDSPRFLLPKYEQVMGIRLPVAASYVEPSSEDDFYQLMEELPRGFTKDFQYGLGLPREYKAVIDAVEKLTDCVRVVFDTGVATHVDGDVLYFNLVDFEEIRAELDRITSRANAAASGVKLATARNELAAAIGASLVPIPRGNHPVRQLISDVAAGRVTLDRDEQDHLVAAVVEQAKVIGASRPEKLEQLRSDIEFAALDNVIDLFERSLAARHPESYWQDFFKKHPLALHLAFGYPVVQVQDQASVGGRRLSGSGEKIADFVAKNALTNNICLFEIKTPQTKLLAAREYRQGVYGPSSDLAGAQVQVLDQRYQLLKSFVVVKEVSRLQDVEVYAVRCCVVAGTMPKDVDEAKSYEVFRVNSKDVEMVTYDEVLLKLRQLRDILRPKSQVELVADGNSKRSGEGDLGTGTAA